MMGISCEKFKKSKLLNSIYKIVSWNNDRNNKPFVSTIEGRYYPFYGVQWHPERSDDADCFAKFLCEELLINQISRPTKNFPIEKKLQYRTVHCMTYSDKIYNFCNFYWHQKTSEHNKELCSVLNVGTPINNSV